MVYVPGANGRLSTQPQSSFTHSLAHGLAGIGGRGRGLPASSCGVCAGCVLVCPDNKRTVAGYRQRPCVKTRITNPPVNSLLLLEQATLCPEEGTGPIDARVTVVEYGDFDARTAEWPSPRLLEDRPLSGIGPAVLTQPALQKAESTLARFADLGDEVGAALSRPGSPAGEVD